MASGICPPDGRPRWCRSPSRIWGCALCGRLFLSSPRTCVGRSSLSISREPSACPMSGLEAALWPNVSPGSPASLVLSRLELAGRHRPLGPFPWKSRDLSGVCHRRLSSHEPLSLLETPSGFEGHSAPFTVHTCIRRPLALATLHCCTLGPFTGSLTRCRGLSAEGRPGAMACVSSMA